MKYLLYFFLLFFILLYPTENLISSELSGIPENSVSDTIDLDSLESIVLKKEFSIISLKKQIDRLIKKRKIKKREYYPSLTGEYSEANSGNKYYDTKKYNISLDYLLYDSDKRKDELKNININIKYKELKLNQTSQEVLYKIRNLYYQSALLNSQIVLYNKNIDEAQKQIENVTKKIKLKKALQIDLLQQEVYHDDLVIKKNEINNQLLLLLSEIRLMAKLPEKTEIDLNIPVEFNFIDLSFDSMYKTALDNSYDIQIINNTITKLENNRKLMKENNKLNFNLRSGYNFEDYNYANVSNNREIFIYGVASYSFDKLKLPLISSLFSANRNRDLNKHNNNNNDQDNYSVKLSVNEKGTVHPQILENKVSLLQNNIDYEVTKNQLYLDVYSAVLKNSELKNKYQVYQKKIAVQQEIVRKYTVLYELGKVLSDNLIEQKQKLLEVELELEKVKVDYILNLYNLCKICGSELEVSK